MIPGIGMPWRSLLSFAPGLAPAPARYNAVESAVKWEVQRAVRQGPAGRRGAGHSQSAPCRPCRQMRRGGRADAAREAGGRHRGRGRTTAPGGRGRVGPDPGGLLVTLRDGLRNVAITEAITEAARTEKVVSTHPEA